MLALTRHAKESIEIGENIRVKVVRIKGNAVRLAIEAPDDVTILRSELKQHSQEQSQRPVDELAGRHV